MFKYLIWMAIAILLAACNTPAATSVPTATAVPDTATPPLTATQTLVPTPTKTPTITPSPTPFVTPPAPGQQAILPILMYHHIADLPSNASELDRTWTVSPANFEAQIAMVAQRGFHTVTMAQVASYLKKGQPLPSKPIVVSFDDGWAEGYTIAFPILKKYNLIGTFFVYTGALDHKAFLQWAQLEDMSRAGMDIESHTQSHPHLRDLSPDQALQEIAGSKAILEKRLGKPVSSIGYPFGEYSNSVIDLVKRAGFESAVTIAAGYKQRPDEVYTLHRTRISYTDTLRDVTSRLP